MKSKKVILFTLLFFSAFSLGPRILRIKIRNYLRMKELWIY